MIQLFKEKGWTVSLFRKCRIFKEKIEMRTTGIVGILEVNQGHNRMLTIFEEELYCKGEDGSIHNERIFRVFADQESDWKNEVESAINKATSDMNPDMKAPEPEVSTRFPRTYNLYISHFIIIMILIFYILYSGNHP